MKTFEHNLKNKEHEKQYFFKSLEHIQHYFLTIVIETFEVRFSEFTILKFIQGYIKIPFGLTKAELCEVADSAKELIFDTDQSDLQFVLLDIQGTEEMKNNFMNESLSDFFTNCMANYPNCKKIVILFLTVFRFTYNCESSFSDMNSMKNIY